MNECLVTKLKGESTAVGLKKLNEIVFNVVLKDKTDATMTEYMNFNIRTLIGVTISLENATFVNPQGGDTGTSYTQGVAGELSLSIHILNENAKIKISNKGSISSLGTSYAALGSPYNGGVCKYSLMINTEEFKFMPQIEAYMLDHSTRLVGSLNDINNTSLRWVNMFNPNHTADIPYSNYKQYTSGNFDKFLSAPNADAYTLGYFVNSVDITKLSTNIRSFEVYDGETVGNLTDVSSLNRLVSFVVGPGNNNFTPSKITGTIDNFTTNNVNPLRIHLPTCEGVTGNVDNLGISTYFFQGNKKASYTYSKVKNRKTIMTLESVTLSAGLDQYLIDMSALPLHPLVGDPNAVGRWINIYGTRTSTSDAAVTAIKAKGVNVLVNDTLL